MAKLGTLITAASVLGSFWRALSPLSAPRHHDLSSEQLADGGPSPAVRPFTKGKCTVHESTTTRPLSRREFAKRAGTAALVPLAAGVPVLAIPGAGIATGPPPQEAQNADEPPGADALLEYVRTLYGERLSEEDLAKIREGIVRGLRAGARIREVALANSDEPSFVFRAYRGEGP
jgi:hypothetical protein